ncbi:MAG: hypothetical protein HYY13_12645 [Nitrospirae bacterium]|nr:hypothetical protein [Nitrospirota bacterium]
MKWYEETGARFSTIGRFVAFLWRIKSWWMIPVVIVTLFLGLALISAEVSPIAGFIYTLF